MKKTPSIFFPITIALVVVVIAVVLTVIFKVEDKPTFRITVPPNYMDKGPVVYPCDPETEKCV